MTGLGSPFLSGLPHTPNLQFQIAAGFAALTATVTTLQQRLDTQGSTLGHLQGVAQVGAESLNGLAVRLAQLIAQVARLEEQTTQNTHTQYQIFNRLRSVDSRQEMIQANQGGILRIAKQIADAFPKLSAQVKNLGKNIQNTGPETWSEFGTYYKDAAVGFFNPLSVVKTLYNGGSSYLGAPAVAKAAGHAYVAYGLVPKYLTQAAKYCASFFIDLEPQAEQFCSKPYTALWCNSPAETFTFAIAKVTKYGTWALGKGLETTGTAVSTEIKRQIAEGFNNFGDEMRNYIDSSIKNTVNSFSNPFAFDAKSSEMPKEKPPFNFEDGVPLDTQPASSFSHSSSKPTASDLPGRGESDLVPIAILACAAALTYIIGSQVSKLIPRTAKQPVDENINKAATT
ncbi:MAG: hypothetical protein S4CHLAM6_02000 [Chlamydiae bacterium]|nr:hypothetical protein [Chlamydiota bacterium]